MTKADTKADVWMPVYVGDYLADTARLTTEQHGAYYLMMLDYWRNGAPPDDDAILQNIARLSKFLWKKHRPVLEKFFTVESGLWRHKRIEAELLKAKSNKAQAVEKATKAAEARWSKGDASSNAQAMLDSCPSPSPSTTTSKVKVKTTVEQPTAATDESPAAPQAANDVEDAQEGLFPAEPEPEPAQATLALPTEPAAEKQPTEAETIEKIFNYWRKVMESPKSKLDDKRKAAIRRALKSYEPHDLCRAIHGCSLTPHNMGNDPKSNPTGQKYNGIELILRNADQIDRFMANSLIAPKSAQPKSLSQLVTDANKGLGGRLAALAAAKGMTGDDEPPQAAYVPPNDGKTIDMSME